MSPKRDGVQIVLDIPEVDLGVEQDTDGLYGSGSFIWDEVKQDYVDYAVR